MRFAMNRVLNGLMMVLFATAAIVQYNDPDPVLWMTIYGSAALCTAFFLGGRLPFWVPTLLSVLYGTGALYLSAQVFGGVGFFDPTGQEMIGVKEPGREMLGLLFTAGWTAALAVQVGRRVSTEKEKRMSQTQE
ncbi:MAG: transmembrane 220 family protein [Salinibacter sp.]